jgi:DNA-binding NtrC family response regulator
MIHLMGRVLVIDARSEWLSFAKLTLSEVGYEVEVAGSVREAMEILSIEDAFDLILADRRVAETESDILRDMIWVEPDRRRRVVVVFPTQLALGKMRVAFKLGAFDCVDKQYERDKLIDAVRGIFDCPFSSRRRGRRLPGSAPSLC